MFCYLHFMLNRVPFHVNPDGRPVEYNERPKALFLSPGRQRGPIRSILESGKIPLSPLRMGFCEIRHPPILIKFFEITNSINNDVLRGLQHRSSTWGIVVGVCHTPRHYKNQIEGVLQNQGVKMCYHFSDKKGAKL